MTTTHANRRALIAELITSVVVVGLGLLLDVAGVHFPSTLIPALVATGIVVAVLLLVRRRG